MQTPLLTACVVAALTAGCVAAADNPFLGVWELNPAKSRMRGTTTTFEQTPSGDIRSTDEQLSYTFKTDGREYDAPGGGKITWTQSDDKTWTSITKQDGNTIVTSTRTISPDGKTMTVVSKGTEPSGEAFEDTTVFERVSGGSGLIGQWRTGNVRIRAPRAFSIEPNGEDGIILNFLGMDATCAAKFDGKDYALTGRTFANAKLAIQRKGPRSFELIQKQNGKALYRFTFTVSADGKTMKSKEAPFGVKKETMAVYDRRS